MKLKFKEIIALGDKIEVVMQFSNDENSGCVAHYITKESVKDKSLNQIISEAETQIFSKVLQS